MSEKIIVSSPGRMCLIGEHQDYFGLPVISAAINRRITVEIEKSGDDKCVIDCPDVNEHYEFSLKDFPLKYEHKRDYIRSLANIAYRKEWIKSEGFKAKITGDIPLQAGVSSSSALCVVWGVALRMLYTGELGTPQQNAFLGFTGEVREFEEPGGMQDHIASAYGGMVYMDFRVDPPTVEKVTAPKGTFILGDSCEPKATIGGIQRIKDGVHGALEKIQEKNAGSTLVNLSFDEAGELLKELNVEEESKNLLLGTLATRDITTEAYKLLGSNKMNDEVFGDLLKRQHEIERELLKISTPKIERLNEAAYKAGALGCKIVGSGGGGCMLAYAPDNAEGVAKAIEKAGGKPLFISIDEGSRVE